MSFGPQFATNTEFVRRGFDRIAAGLSLPWGAAEPLFRAFLTVHQAGTNLRDTTKALREVIGDDGWRWPFFEQWAADFVRRRLWPLWWSQSGINQPGAWEQIRPWDRLELLALTLDKAAYIERDFAGFLDLLRDGVVRVKLTLKSGDVRCLASTTIEAEQISAINAGDYKNLPPYFPGDPTTLRIVFPSRRR